MMKVLASDQVSEHVKRTSQQYLSCNVSNPPKLAKKTSCDDVHKSNDVPLIPVSLTSSTDQNSSLYILRKLQELESQAQALESKVAKLESEKSILRGENAELKDQVTLMQSNVTILSKRQHEHQGKFDNLKKTGVDVDMPVEDGGVLLQSRDFSEANSRGVFFLAQQTQIARRLAVVELEAAVQRDAQKLK